MILLLTMLAVPTPLTPEEVAINELRTAACKGRASTAYEFALDVDRGFHPETLAAVQSSACNSLWYAKNIMPLGPVVSKPSLTLEEVMMNELRTSACEDAHEAYLFARDADKGFHPETQKAVSGQTHTSYLYGRDVMPLGPV